MAKLDAVSDSELRRELRRRKAIAKAFDPNYVYVEYTVTLVHRVARNEQRDGKIITHSDEAIIAEARDYFDRDNVNHLARWSPDSSLINYEIGSGEIVTPEGDEDWLPK